MTIFVSIPILLYISRFISGLGSAMAVVVSFIRNINYKKHC